MRKKVLPILLSAALVVTTTEYGMTEGKASTQEAATGAAIQKVNEDLPHAKANALMVAGGLEGTDYVYQNNVLTVKSSTPLTISGTTTTDHIEVDKNVSADITLDNVTITCPDNHPFGMEGAVVKLTLNGTNTLNAPKYRAALYCPEGSSLTIEGEGTLNAYGNVKGGGAGIGGESAKGNFYEDTANCGEITINSGNVNAICETRNLDIRYPTLDGRTVAIGGLGGGPITINGGNVKAIAGELSVGIGAIGDKFNGIFINGGTVTAETKYGSPFDDFGTSTSWGPAIGVTGGRKPNYSNIIITGGTVTAKSNFGCAGIGGGRDGSGGIITITGDADVTAIGGEKASGIGAGYVQNGQANTTIGDGGVITIGGNAKVNAVGGINGAGIGGGCPRQVDVGNKINQDGWSGTITITDNADVTAKGGVDAPGIGSGASTVTNATFSKGSKAEKIVLTGNAKVNAIGGNGSITDIGPGKLPEGGANLAPEFRFEEYICTIPSLINAAKIPAQNSLTVDSDGNYIVIGTVTLNTDIQIAEGKELIIKDGSVLKVPAGINLEPRNSVKTEGSGKLMVEDSVAAEFLLTVENGIGGGSFIPNTIHNISATIPEGKEFAEWKLTSGVGNISDRFSPNTTFIMGNGDAKVTAVLKDKNSNKPPINDDTSNDDSSSGGDTSSGGNSSGNTSVNTSNSSNNKNNSQLEQTSKVNINTEIKNNTATLEEKELSESIKQAKKDALEKKTDKLAIEVDLTSVSNKAKVNLPLNSLKQLVDNKADLTFHSSGYSAAFDYKALKSIGNHLKKDCQVVLTKTDISSNKNAKKLISNRPVFKFDLQYKDSKGKTVSYNKTLKSGEITYFVSYNQQDKENLGSLFAVSVDKSGKTKLLNMSAYDSNKKGIRFSANYLSTFGVGYKKPEVTYTDIKDHWAKDSIEFVAARNYMLNDKNKKFNPNGEINKADIVTVLGRVSGIDAKKYKKNDFKDLKADEEFAPYAQWAAEKGIIAKNTADKFSSDEKITRLQLAVIVADYFEKMGYEVPVIHKKETFNDYNQISSKENADKLIKMQQAGIIAEKSGGYFKPNDIVTKAELSATLQRLVLIMIEPEAGQEWQMNDSGQAKYYQNGTCMKVIDK